MLESPGSTAPVSGASRSDVHGAPSPTSFERFFLLTLPHQRGADQRRLAPRLVFGHSTCLLCCPMLYSDPDGFAVRIVRGNIVHDLMSGLPALPNSLVESTLRRLGDWKSSVERPYRSVLHQQLGMLGSGPTEFTVHQDRPEQLLRFQGYQAERQFWLDQLPNIEADDLRINRFQLCGAYSWVSQDLDTGQLFLRGESCKLRVCPVCRRVIQRRSARRVLDFMDSRPNLKWQFQTFTLKHAKTELTVQLNRLVRCFRRLRQRKLWRESVSTGYAVIEVTFHPKGSLSQSGRIREQSEWHPHLHVLAATEFIDWGLLRKAWFDITGDSDNIDCQLVQSSTHAAHYVAKYIGKPPDLHLRAEPSRAAEYYKALNHRRLLMPFGATSKHQPPTNPPRSNTVPVCRFSALLTASANGCYPARCMLTYIILATVPRPKPHSKDAPNLFNRGPP